MTDHDITALVSSRICHDLISPIGAISNGVELLSGTGAGASPELGLIGDSVTSATDRLRCFRIAFGSAAKDASLPAAEVTAAVQALFHGRSSVTIVLQAASLPRITAKALLLALLCQERCLPMGGETKVKIQAGGFHLHTDTARVKDVGALWSIVDRAATRVDIAPAEVQFLLLGQMLQHTGARLNRDIGDKHLTITVSGLIH